MAAELFTAIKGGDKAAVERLLERDRTLVDARNEQGLSPILAALYRSEDDIAAAILRRGPKLTVFEAAAAGDAARVREIVGRDRAEATAVAPDGYSAARRARAASPRCTLPSRRMRAPSTSRSCGCSLQRELIRTRRASPDRRRSTRSGSPAIAKVSTCL